MNSEMMTEILDLLDTGWTDEQIVGYLLRNYQIETAEARAMLGDALDACEEEINAPITKWKAELNQTAVNCLYDENCTFDGMIGQLKAINARQPQ